MAHLVPLPKEGQPGTAKGKVWLAEDFDAPLPEDLLAFERLLLDTHAFLHWVLGDPRLSPLAEASVKDSGSQAYLSAVRVWEMVIKLSLAGTPLVSYSRASRHLGPSLVSSTITPRALSLSRMRSLLA